MKKIYREVLNFSKSELLGLRRVGIQTGAMLPVSAGTDVSSFGFFGDGNNMNTFYPDMEPEDWEIKPEDLVDVPFRLLSATIVGGNSWKATDFRTAGVLKSSMMMLDKKPVFFDHTQDVPNWLGITTGLTWQDTSTAADGTIIPAGINGFHRIDAKSNPKIVRGLKLGAIGSNSVTVQFDWTPSHTYDSADEFYNKMGTIDPKDGEMVCRKVTKILDYHETSLVWLGADPFAKQIDSSGNLVHVDKNAVQYSKENPFTFDKADATEKATYDHEKKFIINFAIDEKTLSLSKNTTKVTLTNKKNIQMKKVLLAFLAAFGSKLSLNINLSDDATELTPDQEAALTAAFGKMSIADPANAENAKIAAFAKGLKLVNDKGELVDFDMVGGSGAATVEYHIISTEEKKRVYDVAATVTEEFKANATAGAAFMRDKTAECIRLYKLQVGDNYDEAVEALISNAKDSKTLDGLLKQYTKGSLTHFSAHCSKCDSSDNIEMRSSIPTGTPNTQTTSGFKARNIADIISDSSKTPMFIGRS